MINIKIILEIIFFSTLRKITVGGFVNHLIKKFWPKDGSIFLLTIILLLFSLS